MASGPFVSSGSTTEVTYDLKNGQFLSIWSLSGSTTEVT